MRRPEGEPLRLPPGYRLDRSDPDVWALCRGGGWAVTHFQTGQQPADSSGIDR